MESKMEVIVEKSWCCEVEDVDETPVVRSRSCEARRRNLSCASTRLSVPSRLQYQCILLPGPKHKSRKHCE